ncbi:MAG: hypothetical protein U0271_10030 [Polyangiaceae bacterium]
MKALGWVLAGLVALVGCGDDGTGGSGATGNAGGAGGSGGNVNGVGGNNGVSSTGVGGNFGGGGCVSCAVSITPGENPDGLPTCVGLSTELYDGLVNCMCIDACVVECGDNICAGGDIMQSCQDCILDTVAGCGNQFNDCANDL